MSMELREEARRREREQREIRESRERLALDIRSVASRPEGARLLAWLVGLGGIFRADYLPGPDGAYAAGKKAAALDLWHLLREALPRDAFVAIALGGDDNRDARAAGNPEENRDEVEF